MLQNLRQDFQDLLNILADSFATFLIILENWWWIIVPLILFFPLKFIYGWWRFESWIKTIKPVLLEIKIPKEVLKPLRAMEQVFSGFFGNIYDPPNWKEYWIEGKRLIGLSLEIVSIGGEPHFFIRVPETHRDAIEATIYSQYPDAEISIVDDYTKYVPQDIPNKDWDLWGADYEMLKEDVYPIKTYSKFFEERPEVSIEEKRLDPLSPLLEGMGKLGPGEQLWVQINITPITNKDNNYVTRGRKIADRLAKRPEEEKLGLIPIEALKVLITGKPVGGEKPKEAPIIPSEMRLTPGEKEIVEAVERKISHYAFQTFIRFIYLGKREVFFKPHIRIPMGFFSQFCTTNLNGLKPWGRTITKIHYILVARRTYLRKRKIFKNYIKRAPPLFPRSGGTFVLDIEELATLYHFPGRIVAPAPFIARVEAKKGEAPPSLPTE